MNIIAIHGRLTKKPELRYTEKQTPVCTFTVAVQDNYNREHTDFFNCVGWQKSAELICKNLDKGSEIVIEGSMHQRKYTDKNGEDKYTWELTIGHFDFCGSKKENAVTIEYSEYEDEGELPFM